MTTIRKTAVQWCALVLSQKLRDARIGDHGYGMSTKMQAEVQGIVDALENESLLDNCQVCHGTKGGVRGNENVVDGVVLCDYCDAARGTTT